MKINSKAAKSQLVAKEEKRREALHEMYMIACRDFNAITAVLIEKYNPPRIYQWGSLLDEKLFWEHSDIDIGIKGMQSARQHADMQADAESLTDFPVDLVNMDKIDPLYAEHIVRRGRIVYERR